MTDDPIERLPSHIADLLELEKGAYPEELERKRAVFARVERALILAAPLASTGRPGGAGRLGKMGAGAGAGAAAKGATLGKFLAVGLAAFAAGGIVGNTVAKRTVPVAAPQPAPVAVTPAPTVSGVLSANVPPSFAVSDLPRVPASLPSHAAPPQPNASPADSSGDLSRERELLDVARAALSRGMPEDAIVAAKKHAERWPRGVLAEEREVVLIQALVAAGRRDDAEQRAAQFRRTFPRSMFAPAVAAALATTPTSP